MLRLTSKQQLAADCFNIKMSQIMRFSKKTKGQLMITTVLILGGVVISAASLLGFLIVYKLRQATDIADSAKAVFASDTGREWELWQALKLGDRLGTSGCPSFANGAGFETIVGISDDSAVLNIISVGKASKNTRAWMWIASTNNITPTSTYPIYPNEQISAHCF